METLTDIKIEKRPVATLAPYAQNARTHTDEQIAEIAASIKQFGWTVPVLVDGDAGIIAGHGRVLAAEKLGMTEVPVIELRHLTPEQVRAYRIADNKLTENGGWDDALLADEMKELDAAGFDVNVLGFSGEELSELIKNTEAKVVNVELGAPAMTWVLLGIPTIHYHKISELVTTIAETEDTFVDICVNSDQQENEEQED
jgi:ParB-like chromosome segregation protein Spo0J